MDSNFTGLDLSFDGLDLGWTRPLMDSIFTGLDLRWTRPSMDRPSQDLTFDGVHKTFAVLELRRNQPPLGLY